MSWVANCLLETSSQDQPSTDFYLLSEFSLHSNKYCAWENLENKLCKLCGENIYMYIYIYIYILYVYVIYIYFLSHTYCQTGMQLLVCQFLLSQAWFSLLSIRLQDSLIIIFSKKEGIDMLVFCMVLVIKGS